MDKKFSIAKVKRMNASRYILIPYVTANAMGVEEGDYVRLEYDEENKEMKIKKI